MTMKKMTAAVETKDITGIIDKPGNVLDDINSSKLPGSKLF